MKSTWFNDRTRYDFARCLSEADHTKTTYDLMRLWLACASCSMRQAVHVFQTGLQSPEIESEYLKAIQQVKNAGKFAECFAIMVNSLHEKPCDFLGSTISELGQNDVSWKGQCFTPGELSTVIAQMLVSDQKPDPSHRLMLSEPACGGGSMVIAASNVLKANGFNPWDYWFVCVDVDWRMFASCYIQCTLLGIPATVIHGNTLSLEEWQSEITLVGAMHPIRRQQETCEKPDTIAEEIEWDSIEII